MKKLTVIQMVICYLLGYAISFPLAGQVPTAIAEQVEEERTNAYADQLEAYLRQYLVDQYEARAASTWNRDYSSIDAFDRSVAANRSRWETVIKPPTLRKSGSLSRQAHPYVAGMQAEWIELPLGPVIAQAILAFPPGVDRNNPAPVVIAQHGIGSFPEIPFGGHNEDYHAYARELLEAGFAVLAPMNLKSVKRRNHIERLCRLADTSLPGIELAPLQHLLDVVLADPRIDANRVGMWGGHWVAWPQCFGCRSSLELKPVWSQPGLITALTRWYYPMIAT